MSTGLASVDSTNRRSKIIGEKKKLHKVPKSKIWICLVPATIYIALHCLYNYLHSIYNILGIISNLEMISSIQEDVQRLYAHTVCHFIKGLEHPWGGWECPGTIPCRYWRGLYLLSASTHMYNLAEPKVFVISILIASDRNWGCHSSLPKLGYQVQNCTYSSNWIHTVGVIDVLHCGRRTL